MSLLRQVRQKVGREVEDVLLQQLDGREVEDVLLQQLDGNLPSDVLLNILLRLPLMSLCQVRWVCKSWYNAIYIAITHSHFAKLHYSIKRSSPSVVLNRKQDFALVDHQVFDNHLISTTALTLKLSDFDHERFCFIGCVNGLFCYSSSSMVVPHSYYICNTITQEHVILPTLPPQLITDHVGLHKVIRIYPTSSISSAEVCTLGLGKWRRIENVPSFRNYSPVCEFINGSLHWLTFDENHNMVIVSFNVSTEKFRIIPSPPVANTNIQSIGVLEDCLRIVSLTYNRDLINDGIISDHDFIMELWVMKNYGVQESWTKEYVFPNAIPTLLFSCNHEVMRTGNGEFVVFGCNGIWNMELSYYEPKTKSYWPIEIHRDVIEQQYCNPISFMGSLFSPKSIIEASNKARSCNNI